jgi:adenine-specific DNA-methyltransferase
LKTVFIGGSRKVTKLSAEVRARIDRIVEQKLHVVIGDANGADKAVQRYLAERHHALVEVFSADSIPRNNLGGWPVRVVTPRGTRKDFQYYAAKDRAMAAEASVGLMLWDGESHGTLMNVMRLATAGKPVVIYMQLEAQFIDVRSRSALSALISELGAGTAARLHADAAAEGLTPQVGQSSLGFG